MHCVFMAYVKAQCMAKIKQKIIEEHLEYAVISSLNYMGIGVIF